MSSTWPATSDSSADRRGRVGRSLQVHQEGGALARETHGTQDRGQTAVVAEGHHVGRPEGIRARRLDHQRAVRAEDVDRVPRADDGERGRDPGRCVGKNDRLARRIGGQERQVLQAGGRHLDRCRPQGQVLDLREVGREARLVREVEFCERGRQVGARDRVGHEAADGRPVGHAHPAGGGRCGEDAAGGRDEVGHQGEVGVVEVRSIERDDPGAGAAGHIRIGREAAVLERQGARRGGCSQVGERGPNAGERVAAAEIDGEGIASRSRRSG